MEIKVNDKFQEYIDKNISQSNFKIMAILNEIIFYGIFIYYYNFGPIHDSDKTFLILKFISVIFILRYMFNFITHIETKQEKQETFSSYFQLNSKIAIFAILILFLSVNQSSHVNYTSLIIILLYALLSSSVKYGLTIDNIITILVTYSLFYSKIII